MKAGRQQIRVREEMKPEWQLWFRRGEVIHPDQGEQIQGVSELPIHWIIEKAREFQKNIYFCFTDYTKAFDCVDHNKLWKILQEMGILDHLTCLLRNLYAGQEVTVRTRHGTTDWLQIMKRVRQGCILSPCLFNLYAEYTLGLTTHKLESRWPGETSITSDMQMTLPLWEKEKRN